MAEHAAGAPAGKPRRQLEPIGGEGGPGVTNALLAHHQCAGDSVDPVYVGRARFGRTESLTNEHRTYRRDESRTVKHGKYRRERPEDAWTMIDAPALVSEEVWTACQE
jgi:hypothetical protein